GLVDEVVFVAEGLRGVREEVDLVDEADDGVAEVRSQAGQEVGEDVRDRLLQPVAEISEPAQGPEDTATSAATIASWLRHGEGRSGERHGNRRDNQHWCDHARWQVDRHGAASQCAAPAVELGDTNDTSQARSGPP